MATFNSAVLTAKGIHLLAKVQAEDASVEFTRAATGAGEWEEGESLEKASELKDPRQSFGFSSVNIINEATVFLKFIISNKQETGNLLHGYYIKEVGIYATDPDEGEILYAIATAEDDHADYLGAYNDLLPSTIIMDFYIEVSNAESATIVGGTGAYASVDDLLNLKAKVDAVARTVSKDIIVTAEGWVPVEAGEEGEEDSDERGIGNVVKTIQVRESMPSITPILVFYPKSLGIASDCGICAVQTLAKQIKIYAKTAPTEDMKANLVLLSAVPGELPDGGVPVTNLTAGAGMYIDPTSENSATIGLDLATEDDLNDMFTE